MLPQVEEFEGSVMELETELTSVKDDVTEEFSAFQSEMVVQFTEATTRFIHHPTLENNYPSVRPSVRVYVTIFILCPFVRSSRFRPTHL